GGVHVRKTPDAVRDVAAKMLGQVLVTHQTGPAGRLVNKVLVAESADIAREMYFAILLDRATAAPVIVASTEGGLGIECGGAKSKRQNMGSITLGSTAISRASSMAQALPWRPWTSSNFTAASRRISSISPAAQRKRR